MWGNSMEHLNTGQTEARPGIQQVCWQLLQELSWFATHNAQASAASPGASMWPRWLLSSFLLHLPGPLPCQPPSLLWSNV